MRYFVAVLMLVSIGMFAMGCGDADKPKPKDTPAVENGDNGNGPVEPTTPEPGPTEPTP